LCAASRMPFPRRVYDPPPATNEEIAIVLRKLQIWRKELKGLLITGLVVLKTAVHAIDQDLEVTVLSDLCVDADQARHDACMDAVFPTLARVMPSDEWLAALGRPGGGGGPDGSPQKTAAGALRGLL